MATEVFPHPEKDQHLLTDKNILAKEIKIAELSKQDKVIEIGAGTGILTEKLAQCVKKLIIFEIDEQFKENLNTLKKSYNNIIILYKNALDSSWKGYDKIVSNIPYTLSEPIILKAIKEGIPFLVLIVSEGFKDVLMDRGTKLGFTAQIFYNIKVFDKVGKSCFSPSPSVNSFLIKLEKKEIQETDNVSRILASFVLKKGKIKNSLIFSLVEQGRTKNQAREILEKLNLPEKILDKPVEKATGKFLQNLEEGLKNML